VNNFTDDDPNDLRPYKRRKDCQI